MSFDAARQLLKDDETAALLYILNPEPDTTRIVGGAVRDALLGRTVHDIDLATQLLPDQVIAFCEAHNVKAVPTGIEFGTVTIVTETRSFEITTLREDIETDGRHAVVKFGLDWMQDAARRDFTINALYLSQDGDVHAPVGGLDDIENGVVRFIGDANARIAEDYLRIWRFFRFSASYAKGAFDKEGMTACAAGKQGLKHVSAERVKQELWKLLSAPRADETLDIMSSSGLLLPLLGTPDLQRFTALKRKDPLHALAALFVTDQDDAHRLSENLRLSRAERQQLDSIAAALEGLQGGCDADMARKLYYFHPQGFPVAAEILGSAFAKMQMPPPFPLKGADLIAAGFEPGPEIGEALKKLEKVWIESAFELSGSELLELNAAKPRSY